MILVGFGTIICMFLGVCLVPAPSAAQASWGIRVALSPADLFFFFIYCQVFPNAHSKDRRVALSPADLLGFLSYQQMSFLMPI